MTKRFTLLLPSGVDEIYARYFDDEKDLSISCTEGSFWLLNTSSVNGVSLIDNEYHTFEELCEAMRVEIDPSLWLVDSTGERLNKYLVKSVEEPENGILEALEDFKVTEDAEVYTEDLGKGTHKSVVPPLSLSDNTIKKMADYLISAISNKVEEANKNNKDTETDGDGSETKEESLPYTIEDFNNKVQGVDANYLMSMCRIKKAVLLISHPGTGKTTTAIELARYITKETNSDRVLLMSFNQSTSYTDTIGGIGKRNAKEDWDYIIGSIAELCDRASKEPDKPYIAILDEINRAYTESVLGEIITAMAKRGEKVITNSGKVLVVPKNVWFIGTMNSTDNSVSELDTALVDRFMIYSMPEILIDCSKIIEEKEKELGIKIPESLAIGMEYVNDAIKEINKQLITNTYKGKDNQIGNRALYNDHENLSDLILTVRYDIQPKVKAKYEALGNTAIDEIERIFRNLDENLKKLYNESK